MGRLRREGFVPYLKQGSPAIARPNADALVPDYDPKEAQVITMKLYQKAKG
jgi:hypothetical protein